MYELQSNSSTSTRQQLYYILDQFDGWLLGPSTGLNLGGVKNSHDSMCVTESGRARWVAENIYNSIHYTCVLVLCCFRWGYYDGPTNIDNPETAYPYWRYDDKSLSVRCGLVTWTIYTVVCEQVRPRDQEGDPDLGDGGGQCAGAGPGQDIQEDEASDGGGTEAGQAQCGHVAGQVTIIVEAR